MRKHSLASSVCLVAGSLMIAFWAFARIDSHIGSAAAIAAFQPAGEVVAQAEMTVDTSLWSARRIKEFTELLGVRTPAVGVLRIERLRLEAPVFPDTDAKSLNRGVGWIASTAPLGTDGNSGIAGHRDGFFRPLKDITVGDAIELQTTERTRSYVVSAIDIVDPSRVDVLTPSDAPALTLVTCYPFYHVGKAPQRYIVRASLQPEASPEH